MLSSDLCFSDREIPAPFCKGRSLSTEISCGRSVIKWKPKVSAWRLHFAMGNRNCSVQALKLHSWEACLNFYLNVLSHNLFKKQKIFQTMYSSIQWQYQDNSSCFKDFFNFFGEYFVNYINALKTIFLPFKKRFSRKMVYIFFISF